MNMADKILSGSVHYRNTVVGGKGHRSGQDAIMDLNWFVFNAVNSWTRVPAQSLGRRELHGMPRRPANTDSFLFPDTSRRI